MDRQYFQDPLVPEIALDRIAGAPTEDIAGHRTAGGPAAAQPNLDRERLALALQAGRLGTFEWDLSRSLADLSPELEELYGYAPGEMGGRYETWISAILPEDRPAVEETMRQAMRTGEFQVQFRIRRRDGEIRWMESRGEVLRDGSGRATRMLGINMDITECKRGEAAVREANLRLRQLSSDLLRSQDYERRRIARELHDRTAQLLAALNMTLCHLRDSAAPADQRRELLDEAIDLASKSSREMRVLSYLLHPPLLEELGLPGALVSYADGFRQDSGTEVALDVQPGFGRLDRQLETSLFRIVQEGLANIQRRAGTEAVVRLRRDEREVRLELSDSIPGGVGLAESARDGLPLGVGILGMRARAEQIGGRLETAATPTGGRIVVTAPLGEAA